MNSRVAVIAALAALGSGTVAEAAERWEVAADLGAVRTVGSAPIFDWAACGGGALLVRFRERFGAGVFVAYRQVLDSPTSSSFWYADVGARGRVLLTDSLWLRLDAGWSFRHIGLPDGYSNTVGGLMAGGGLGVIVLSRRNWNLNLAAVYRYTRHLPSELFSTNDVGLDAGWAWKW